MVSRRRLRQIVNIAKVNAMRLVEGGMPVEKAAYRMRAEVAVREKADRKGWSGRKIERRIKMRFGIRMAWEYGKIVVAARPFGGALVSAGDTISAVADRIIEERIGKE